LNGRQLTQLVLTRNGDALRGSWLGRTVDAAQLPSALISVAGGLANGINYILDGANQQRPVRQREPAAAVPRRDAEFKVETNALPAQYGFHSAAAVNAITKSGTTPSTATRSSSSATTG